MNSQQQRDVFRLKEKAISAGVNFGVSGFNGAMLGRHGQKATDYWNRQVEYIKDLAKEQGIEL
ncbi:MAG: hypothetical protein KGL39_57670 [Patescibacteria group bacterium]|nr:hypothetical protein [Patescibacteria group bacterium]